MKTISLLFILILLAINGFSQKANIFWGDEFKMHKGSTDLDVISADNSGVYLQESHLALKSYFVIGASTRESATLIKLDGNLTEQYRNDFNKELRGKEFEQFFTIQNKIFIIAGDYSRKTLVLYAAEIDRNTGNLTGDWLQLANWEKEEKSDNIHFKVSYNADSTKLVLVSSVEGKANNSYQVQEFDKNLKPAEATVNISNEFDPKTFQLEDVLYTNNKKIVLVGRIYEYEEGKRKKDKFLDFARYNIRIYDNRGKQQNEINTDINGKWLVSTKVVQQHDNDLVLAAFYSNEKKGNDINGMLVERIDPNTGSIVSNNQKEINTSLITTVEEDDTPADDANDEDSKKERQEREKLKKIKDESEGFSRYMQFRNIFYTADNGLVILAEKYHHYMYTSQSYSNGQWTSSTYTVYETGDLMMTKIDASGNISWLQVLPKKQNETVYGGSNNYGMGFSIGVNYFGNYNMPFYSGFGALQSGNAINIFFNDHPKNEGVLQMGQHVRMASTFGSSECFNVTLDAIGGKYTRTHFFSNKSIPTAMPRLASVIGKDMYVIGKEDRFFARSKIAVGKISVVN